jgi:hypothetical protein
MFTFVETSNLVVVSYRPDDQDGDIFQSFARGAASLNAAFRLDFLLDLRGVKGPLDILSNEEMGKRWAELSRGRDVGRRTAIVSTDEAIRAQLEVFARIYPFRTIAIFDDYESAAEWVGSIKGQDDSDIQFI